MAILKNSNPFAVGVSASTPTNAVQGTIYFNTTTLTFNYYDGSTDQPVASQSSVTSGAANTSLSNLSNTSVGTNLNPQAPGGVGTYNLGEYNAPWLGVYANSFYIYDNYQDPIGSLIHGAGNNFTISALSNDPLVLTTANQTSLNSANLTLTVGTSSGASRGSIQIQDGSEGVSGQVWTSKDTSGSGTWAPAGANASLSNLTTTSIHVDLIPYDNNNGTATQSLGAYNAPWLNVVAANFLIYDNYQDKIGSLIEFNNGIILAATYASGGFVGSLGFTTANNTSGNSGNITLTTGTATGTRGSIQIQDGTQGTAGYVWTSTDTNGSGKWADVGTAARGTASISAAGTTVTVTNAAVTTSSIIHATVNTNDATAYVKNVVPGSGTFTINLGAAATSTISIGWVVFN